MKTKDLFLKVFHKTFNWKMGGLALVYNGTVAILTNISHGLTVSLRAGLVQMLVAAVIAGIGARIVQYFSKVKNPWLSYGLSFFIPFVLRFVFTFVGHTLNHTPELWLTVGVTVAVSSTFSVVFNFGTRNLSRVPIIGVFFKIPGEGGD